MNVKMQPSETCKKKKKRRYGKRHVLAFLWKCLLNQNVNSISIILVVSHSLLKPWALHALQTNSFPAWAQYEFLLVTSLITVSIVFILDAMVLNPGQVCLVIKQVLWWPCALNSTLHTSGAYYLMNAIIKIFPLNNILCHCQSKRATGFSEWESQREVIQRSVM